MSRVVVIGGGPAGMFAAIAAAENGHHVTLLEKNEKLGKKLSSIRYVTSSDTPIRFWTIKSMSSSPSIRSI